MVEVILRFRQIEYEYYEASMSNTQRQAAINSFHNPGVPFFIMSTRAGGQGLNLQVADTIIHFEADFNPHFDENAVDWVLRFGQNSHAKVLRLVATVEPSAPSNLFKGESPGKVKVKLVVRTDTYRQTCV